jgi:hypothetical protein
LIGFGLYIGDIEELDVDVRFVTFLGIVIVRRLVDEEMDVESLECLFFEDSEERDDCFFGSELFRRFIGL